MRRGRQTLTALGLVVALITAACGGGGGDDDTATTGGEGTDTTAGEETEAAGGEFNEAKFSGEPTEGGRLVMGLEANISSIDPGGTIAQPPDVAAALAIFDRMVTFDDEGLPSPGLATDWESSDDLTTWTFQLREGVTFHDGTEFNADAVVAQIERLQDPATGCNCLETVQDIESVEAVDNLTVEFTIAAPNAFFTTIMAGQVGMIASPTAVEEQGQDFARNPVGTGPFVLDNFGSDLEFSANDNYWASDDEGRQLPYLDELVMRPIPNADSRLQALRNDEVDLIQTADTSTVVEAVDNEDLRIQKVQGTSATITLYNMRQPPYNDVRARRLAAAIVDRRELNEVLYEGSRQPATGPFPPSSPFHAEDVEWPSFNPDLAEELVSELRSEGELSTRTATCIATPEGRTGTTLVAEQARQFGIEVETQFLDQGAYVSRVFADPPKFSSGCFRSPQIADADGLYNSFHSEGTANYSGYSDPEVDQALEDIRATTDAEEHKRLLAIVQEKIAEDVPVHFLLYDLFANIFSPDISGLPVPQANYLGAIKPSTLYRKA